MRVFILGTSMLIVLAVIGPTAESQRGVSKGVPHPLVTQAEYDRWQTELSNWMRWGKDDELGALNLITPAKRRDAVAYSADNLFANSPRGDSIWVFSLKGTMDPVPAAK